MAWVNRSIFSVGIRFIPNVEIKTIPSMSEIVTAPNMPITIARSTKLLFAAGYIRTGMSGLSNQAEDPESFAEGLRYLSDYRLFLNYQTKRIGGTTDIRTVLIEGDFSDYRDSIIKKWQARKMGPLPQLVSGCPSTKIG